MREPLNSVAEIIAKANDSFFAEYKSVDTLVGIIDKALRAQGMPADAVTIDSPAIDKKLVFLLHDQQPDSVEIALGNKMGDIHSSSKISLSEFNEAYVLATMKSFFINHH